MKKKKLKQKKANPVAKELFTNALFRAKVVPNKKKEFKEGIKREDNPSLFFVYKLV